MRLKKCNRVIRVKTFCVFVLVSLIIWSLGLDWVRQSSSEEESKWNDKMMHLTAVSCGRPNYQGIRDIRKPMDLTITMVKSAVLFAKHLLHVHVFTEEDMMAKFDTAFKAWPSFIQSRVKFSLYKIDYEQYLPGNLAAEWKKWYKPCGSYRLFIPMILKDVTSAAIYSDSDVIFIKSIDELWAQMKKFSKRHVVAISPTSGHPLGGSEYNENFIPHETGLFQINSGIMVMNFTRMLSSNWLKFHDETSVKSKENVPQQHYSTDLLLDYYTKYKDSAEHDQKLLNIMFHFNPDLIQQLSCSWNFKHNFCQDNINVCADAELGDGAGAVHGITSVFFGDGNPTFRALYENFLKYDFEKDAENNLLRPFIKQLQLTARNTFCGRKSHIIIEPLTQSIQALMEEFAEI